MKFVKKMLATLVACAMAMTLLTACGGVGNGGTVTNNPMLDAVNEILKGNGSEIVLEHSPELDKVVQEVAQVEKQLEANEIDRMQYAIKIAALTENLELFKSELSTDAACAAEVAQEILKSGKELNEAAYGTVSLKGGNYVLVICR